MNARPGIKAPSNCKKLEELYSKLKDYCLFLSQNKWDGEDLAQETIYKAMNHYGQKSDLNAALLKKMARNLWLDQRKKLNREVLGCDPIEKDDYCKIDTDLLEKAISKLTPKQSVIFTLKDGFHFQNSEIAEIFDMTETAVKAVLNRARTRLAKLSSGEELPDLQTAKSEIITRPLLHAIRSGDPSDFIKLIPALFPKESQPTLKVMAFSSPSSSLSMAA
ncbi:sigma-70 family RNA polymerase sigma factor [Halobacillus sp. Marseille-Q1614]|uniref:sigma-70 family RNA polymerase sigma factor n=1 Tax=Halobacillus sp. Marseille-Q1614 TaxID=2709134 RepID=UPI00157070CC|nr:sigma-70 family RNA polymerase sigma factor [Halobacillus sp. Marseille-Q1614]